MTMTADRVKDLLDAYGGNTENWPVNDQVPMQEAIASSTELQKYLSEVERFDKVFARSQAAPVANVQLVDRIMNALPEQDSANSSQVVSISGWFKQLLKPELLSALAASVLVTLLLVNQMAVEPQPPVDDSELFEQWVAFQSTDQPIDESVNDEDADYMEMVALELN